MVTTVLEKYLVQLKNDGMEPTSKYNLPPQDRILCTYIDFAQLKWYDQDAET